METATTHSSAGVGGEEEIFPLLSALFCCIAAMSCNMDWMFFVWATFPLFSRRRRQRRQNDNACDGSGKANPKYKKNCKETTTMTTTLTFILEHNCCLFSFRFPSFLIRTTGEGGRGRREKIICKIRQTTTLRVHVHTPFELRANTMYVHTRTTVESEKIWCGAVLSTLSL